MAVECGSFRIFQNEGLNTKCLPQSNGGLSWFDNQQYYDMHNIYIYICIIFNVYNIYIYI